ncbi:hypothetical protein [Rhodoferax sp.]|uniref:hypothetical protein n=1 Tax=Rhodoferax sp. TaxID=50421 RepID=UPI00374DDE20
MPKVIPPHGRRAVRFNSVERQQAIENALSTALYYVRQPNTTATMLHAATGRANRALSLLKQACATTTSVVEG